MPLGSRCPQSQAVLSSAGELLQLLDLGGSHSHSDPWWPPVPTCARVAPRLCCAWHAPLELCLPPDLVPLQITTRLSLVPFPPHKTSSHCPRRAGLGTTCIGPFQSAAPDTRLQPPCPLAACLHPGAQFPPCGGVVWLLLPRVSGLPLPDLVLSGTFPFQHWILGFGIYCPAVYIGCFTAGSVLFYQRPVGTHLMFFHV